MSRQAQDSVYDRVLTTETDNRTLSQTIADRLRVLIIEGEFPPGTRLRLGQIAERLGVSVMPVREALRNLEAEDLVTFVPRRGAIVSELSAETVEELYAVRAALESVAARSAAPHLDEPAVRELDSLYAEMEAHKRSGDLVSFFEADRSFHTVIYMAAKRPQLFAKIEGLYESTRRTLPSMYKTWLPMDWALKVHKPILVAARHRDAAALASATRVHTEEAARRIVEAMTSTGSRPIRGESTR